MYKQYTNVPYSNSPSHRRNIHYYARFRVGNSIQYQLIKPKYPHTIISIRAQIPTLIPPFAIILLMAEWSVVAARDRKQCEEVPAEWRPEAWMQDCGAFREPATGLDKPDTRPLEHNPASRPLVSKPSSSSSSSNPSSSRARSPLLRS